MKVVVGNVEACQRNVTMGVTLLVTSIHCTTASMMFIIM